MADLQTLATLKNHFFAPLARALPDIAPLNLGDLTRPGPPALPPANATSIVTRHDHHNIEIKTVSELGDAPSVVTSDIYLFVPRTFEIATVGKADLHKDFRSRMRLALPFSGEQGAAALENTLRTISVQLARVEAAERSGEPGLDLGHPLCEELLEATKDLCSVIAETLKHGANEHTRQFFLSHTLFTTADACTSGVRVLNDQIRCMHTIIDRVRTTLSSDHNAPSAALSIFDEYMSQLYVQYLSTIRSELSRIGVPAVSSDAALYTSARSELESMLDLLQAKEARHRLKFGGSRPEEESDLDRERRLVRLSHLKKFFQSKTFVEISRSPSAKRVSESTATIGTALAALIAAVIERYSRSKLGDVAFHGVFVLSLGVIFYVLRDRLKDKAKSVFHEKALKFLPDFEQQLLAKDRTIGTTKEWFRITSLKDVPTDVFHLRKNASASEMEKRLPEDVFHCRKIQEIHSTALSSTHSPTRALHEYTRVNFERYLKHMDDPFKDIMDLDLSGRFRQSRSHRVYHFYLCVKTVTRPLDKALASRLPRKREPVAATREQNLVYRIVLDKYGVVRLEDLAGSC